MLRLFTKHTRHRLWLKSKGEGFEVSNIQGSRSKTCLKTYSERSITINYLEDIFFSVAGNPQNHFHQSFVICIMGLEKKIAVEDEKKKQTNKCLTSHRVRDSKTKQFRAEKKNLQIWSPCFSNFIFLSSFCVPRRRSLKQWLVNQTKWFFSYFRRRRRVCGIFNTSLCKKTPEFISVYLFQWLINERTRPFEVTYFFSNGGLIAFSKRILFFFGLFWNIRLPRFTN